MTAMSGPVLVVAGEASGDKHGEALVAAIRELRPDLRFAGVGGQHLEGAGVELLYRSKDLAVVGLAEVGSHLGALLRALGGLKRRIRRRQFSAAILIDFPDFNLQIARTCRRYGVPVAYYICPQVWAWRRYRVRILARNVSLLLVVLPFEVEFYRRHGLSATYVGNPVIDELQVQGDVASIRSIYGVADGAPIVTLMPGSRRREIRNLLAPLLGAAELVHDRIATARFFLPVADGIDTAMLHPYLDDSPVEVTLVREGKYDVMAASDVILLASGTAALEAGLLGVPMVAVYRGHWLSYVAYRLLVAEEYMTLVNILTRSPLVPELKQYDVTPERIAREALLLLEDEQRNEWMRRELAKLRPLLGEGDVAQRAAREFVAFLEGDAWDARPAH